tara:strand:+ start:7057 stop:7590 length:534 start_codon:yes stop_codon:yes gene_type:complete
MIPKINDKCSKYFRFNDFFECSDTYKKSSILNIPKQQETYDAIKYFSSEILDKVKDKFEDVTLTYGFCGFELSKVIKKNIYPKTDQHAGYEKNSKNNFICERKGFAADFFVKNISSLKVAQWIVMNCKFDRIYFYGNDKPIHVSINETSSKKIVLMKIYNIRRVPKNISIRKFLDMS